MHTSVLPRPQCLLALVFANLMNSNYSNAQSSFTSRSELPEPTETLSVTGSVHQGVGKEDLFLFFETAEVFSTYLYCILFYGEISLSYIVLS